VLPLSGRLGLFLFEFSDLVVNPLQSSLPRKVPSEEVSHGSQHCAPTNFFPLQSFLSLSSFRPLWILFFPNSSIRVGRGPKRQTLFSLLGGPLRQTFPPSACSLYQRPRLKVFLGFPFPFAKQTTKSPRPPSDVRTRVPPPPVSRHFRRFPIPVVFSLFLSIAVVVLTSALSHTIVFFSCT